MIADTATAIKDAITCRQFADFIGLSVNRSGFAVCPFHGEKTASLKIYKDGRGWCCFGCHRGGDVINFASLYYGLSFKDTLKRLNDDFNLEIIPESTETAQNSVLAAVQIAKMKAERKKQERLRAASEALYWCAFDKWIDNERRIQDNAPTSFEEDFSPAFCQALKDREILRERLIELEMERTTYERNSSQPRSNTGI